MSCACGCGVSTTDGRRFRRGHWAKANRATIGNSKRLPAHKPDQDGYIRQRVPFSGDKLQHVIVTERALGKPLPAGAVVHHVDQNRSNNAPSNLVICRDASYHALIHRRMRALEACGHADWRKCWICKRYDEPRNLAIPKNEGKGCIQHLTCLNALRASQKEKR